MVAGVGSALYAYIINGRFRSFNSTFSNVVSTVYGNEIGGPPYSMKLVDQNLT